MNVIQISENIAIHLWHDDVTFTDILL